MTIPPLLHDLLTAFGPSGSETAAAGVWRDAAAPFAEVGGNSMGSVWARVPGTGEGTSVAFMGHIDEIGVMVTHIDEKGFLWLGQVGGWDPSVLVGQRVELMTAAGSIPGVIGRKPIHLMEPDEREKAPKTKELHIDIGATSEEEARAMVRVGDSAIIAAKPLELPGGRIVSRSLDNRVGCYLALRAAELVAEAGGAPGDVYAVAAVQEETDLSGARVVAHELQPDCAVVLDVGFCADAPGVDPARVGKHALGKGPVLARGSMLHPKLFELLTETAAAQEIPHTVQAAPRFTSTDADEVQRTRGGIPTTLVEVPSRYMHSPVEMVQLSDLEHAARLLAAFAQRLEPGMSFAR